MKLNIEARMPMPGTNQRNNSATNYKPDDMSSPLTNAIFGFAGVIVGGFLGHWLAGRRAGVARKLAFIGFLEKWKAEIFSPNPKIIQAGPYRINASIVAYRDGLPDFKAQTAMMRNDFQDRQQFDVLTNTLCGLNEKDWNKRQPRDVICEAIDELLEFCK